MTAGANRSVGGGTSGRQASCVTVSTDAEFRKTLRRTPSIESGRLRMEMVIDTPFPEITDSELEGVRRVDPDVIFLDFESDPQIGFRFASFLVESDLGRVLVGAAPPLSSELLMKAMRAGISEFVPKPIEPSSVEEALEGVWRKIGKAAGDGGERRPGEVLVYFGPKGGVGCTTLCINTGIELHRVSRKKTLVLDLDLELGETALHMGEDPRFSVVDLVQNFHRVDSDLLASYMQHHESGVDLLSAPYRPAEFETASAERAGRLPEFLREHYDYVVVDVSKSLDPATLAALESADHLMMVTTADLPAVHNLTRCLPHLMRRMDDRPSDWLKLLVNRHESGGVITLDQLEETVGRQVYDTIGNDYRIVMNAINTGSPAVMDGGSRFAADVHRLAKRIAGVETGSGDGGWFGGRWIRRLLGAFRNGASAGTSAGASRGASGSAVTSDA